MEKEYFEIDHIEEGIVTLINEENDVFYIPVGFFSNINQTLNMGTKISFNHETFEFMLEPKSETKENTQSRFDRLKKK